MIVTAFLQGSYGGDLGKSRLYPGFRITAAKATCSLQLRLLECSLPVSLSSTLLPPKLLPARDFYAPDQTLFPPESSKPSDLNRLPRFTWQDYVTC